jgi:glucose-6-phosphate isomerase
MRVYVNDNKSKSLALIIEDLKDLIQNTPLFHQFNPLSHDQIQFLDSIPQRHIAILGMGGSTLSAQCFHQALFNHNQSKHIFHFWDHLEKPSFWDHLDDTFFLVISKSGQTSETLAQMLTLVTMIPHDQIPNRFLIITENKDNSLRSIANSHTIPTWDHAHDVGGRYSAFTLTGLVPAHLMGLSIDHLIQGVKECIDHDIDSIAKGAFFHDQAVEATQTVWMSYSYHLQGFLAWLSQLWGESLGKDGIGTTLIPSINPRDQHSQLQLYLDGPEDKTFTFITTNNHSFLFPTIQYDVNELKGKTISDLLNAQYKATMDEISAHHPTREIVFDHLNEINLSKLMMRCIIEVLALSIIWEVNPFDQPAVESGKKRTADYLKG